MHIFDCLINALLKKVIEFRRVCRAEIIEAQDCYYNIILTAHCDYCHSASIQTEISEQNMINERFLHPETLNTIRSENTSERSDQIYSIPLLV